MEEDIPLELLDTAARAFGNHDQFFDQERHRSPPTHVEVVAVLPRRSSGLLVHQNVGGCVHQQAQPCPFRDRKMTNALDIVGMASEPGFPAMAG